MTQGFSSIGPSRRGPIVEALQLEENTSKLMVIRSRCRLKHGSRKVRSERFHRLLNYQLFLSAQTKFMKELHNSTQFYSILCCYLFSFFHRIAVRTRAAFES